LDATWTQRTTRSRRGGGRLNETNDREVIIEAARSVSIVRSMALALAERLERGDPITENVVLVYQCLLVLLDPLMLFSAASLKRISEIQQAEAVLLAEIDRIDATRTPGVKGPPS